MGDAVKTVAGFKVVAFKIEPCKSYVRQGRKMVQIDVFKVRLWLDRTGGAAPESTLWTEGIHCEDRKFASLDGARRSVLRTFGRIQER